MPSRRRRRHRLAIGFGLLALVLLGAFVRFAAQAHRLHDRLATGPAWSFPSQVYSDTLMLEVGRALPFEYLRAELEARDYRQADALRTPGEWCRRDDGMDIFLRGFHEPVGGSALSEPPERVRLRLASGRLAAIRRLDPAPERSGEAGRRFLEPVRIATLADSDRVMRRWIPLERVARVMREAVIASEDRRFYHHSGIDLKGNARALAVNLQAGAVRQGASTITQQLARGMFLGRDRSVLRKLREAVIALALERVFGKDQILEMYLNSVYFGPAAGERVAGVAEAAARFFGVGADALTLDQAALLAGIIPAPGAFSPIDHPERARRQRDRVLRDLLETGVIDSATARAAMARPLGLRLTARAADRFPSFVGYVRQELRSRLPAGAAEGWGLTIVTTLDPVWQEQAEAALDAGLADRDPYGRAEGALEGAFVALDPATGAVRAMVGGRSSATGDFNRVLRARRQPGSAFKPIVYAAALDPARGAPRFTPGSTVPDLRRAFATPEGPWTPRNDDDEYHESATLAKGLVHSLNVATSNLVERIGPEAVSRYAERFGLGRPAPVASIGLGSQEVTPLALTSAYTVFVNGGNRVEPAPLAAVLDARGRELRVPARPASRVLPEPAAALMRSLLEDVVIFGIAYPLRAEYGFTRPCGGKTGTTNDYADAWFVGFTPELVAGVWVGYDTPKSLGAPAAKVAIPVWAGIMNRLLDGFPATPFPARADQVVAWIDPWSGGLARRDCPHALRVPFMAGTAPLAFCDRDHTAERAAMAARALADSLGDAAADSAGVAPRNP